MLVHTGDSFLHVRGPPSTMYTIPEVRHLARWPTPPEGVPCSLTPRQVLRTVRDRTLGHGAEGQARHGTVTSLGTWFGAPIFFPLVKENEQSISGKFCF